MRRHSKYYAVKTIVNGMTFASKKEAKRYQDLLNLQKAGELESLQLQPTFVLQDSFSHCSKRYSAIKYIADFAYFDKHTRKTVVEDVKGVKTQVYNIKKKFFLRQYGDKYNFKEV